jgi:hypothetical protein
MTLANLPKDGLQPQGRFALYGWVLRAKLPGMRFTKQLHHHSFVTFHRGRTLFENAETTKHVLQVFLRINSQMDDSIRAVEKQTLLEELKAFKRSIGHITSEVFEEIVEPICKRHPSLRPPEMEG